MQRRKAASRSDVAKLAGVAPSTVSLVLNRTPGPRIPDETRRRVMEAADELGYSSSTIAKALVTGRTMTVGVVMHFVERPFYQYSARTLDGVWTTLRPQGYRMLMVPGVGDACVAGLYRERSVDGILVLAAPCEADDAELRGMAASGFPAVLIGTRALAVETDYVDIDNVAVARQATAELIQAGHRDILHLAGPLDVNSAAIERRDGFHAAMRDAGLPVGDAAVLDGSFNSDIAAERLALAMDRGQRFTAIFAANQAMARGALRVLESRGLRVPQDVSMISIDVDEEGRRADVAVDTFDQPLEELGRSAGALLVQRMQGLAGSTQKILLPCRVVRCGSIAPPPA
jgi:LacI family transcriptional regulator